MTPSDPYLNDVRAINRLIFEYDKHKSLVIAFDFDDTVYDFHSKGFKYNKVIESLRNAKKIGCYLICWTGNDDLDFIKEYLRLNDIPFDAINENAPFMKEKNPRKIYANLYLDDRAGLALSLHHLNSVVSYVFSAA